MKSVVQLINQALIFLGQTTIQQLDESAVAVTADSLYEPALEEVLRAHFWNFAVTRKKLAPLAAAPDFGYTYQYALPPDWLRTLEVDAADHRMERRKILCDRSSLQLRYVAKVTDPTQWDALFAQALARNLASKLAYPLTGSTTQQEAQWQMYVAVLNQAKFVDATEEPSEDFEESSLLSVRR